MVTEKDGNKREKNDDLGSALAKMTNRIDAIAGERPSHEEALDFLKKVLTEQVRIKPEIKTQPVQVDEVLFKTKTEEGFPLVAKGELELDIASATKLFERLCDVLKSNENVSGDIDHIKRVIKSKELSLEELFRQTAAEDGQYVEALSDRLNLRTDIVTFLAQNSVKPIFAAYADELEHYVDQERWQKRSYCPICGSKPVMAALRGPERKRFLLCSCCGYEWRFMRATCPFCENDSAKKLRYFHTENQGRGYRVDVCDQCKKYIKTVDVHALGTEVMLPAEDIGTLYLDVLAEKEGYTREIHQLGFRLSAG